MTLCTMIDDNFVIGFNAFINSLYKYHPEIDYDFNIIDVGLSKESKDFIRKKYKGRVFFHTPEYKNYSDIDMSKTAESLKKTYYTFEIFKLDYDRVIFFDMDMIILGDISEVLNCKEDFAAVKGYNAKQDELRADINSGLFVVGKRFLNDDTYKGIINFSRRGFSMPDQKAINGYFKGEIKHFNKRYNVEKRMINTKKFKHIIDDIRILHFVARKPWQSKDGWREEELIYDEFEKFWFKFSDMAGNNV